jgi:hypothetical protein
MLRFLRRFAGGCFMRLVRLFCKVQGAAKIRLLSRSNRRQVARKRSGERNRGRLWKSGGVSRAAVENVDTKLNSIFIKLKRHYDQ